MRTRTKKIIYIVLLILDILLLIAGFISPNWWCADDQSRVVVDGSARGGVCGNSTDPREITPDGIIDVKGKNPVVVVISQNAPRYVTF